MMKGVKSTMKVEINLSFDELTRLLADSDEFKQLLAGGGTREPVTETVDEVAIDDMPQLTKPEPQVEVTLETVRAKLADLMQSGKQAEVKELLKQHGGVRLSDIAKENYPALLADAEAM